MKTRETTRRNLLLLVSVGVLATGLFLLQPLPQKTTVIPRQELPAHSYVALHDGWLYYKNTGKLTAEPPLPGDDSLYVYRLPLRGGASSLFAKLPRAPVRLPAEYSLPSNDFMASAAGLHYLEYKLLLPPSLSKTDAIRFLNASASARVGYARVYTYPWSCSAPGITTIPATSGIVEVLRVSSQQVLYQERRQASRNYAVANLSDQAMQGTPMKRVPLHAGRSAVLSPRPVTAPEAVVSDIVLWPVPSGRTARTVLKADVAADTVYPEQTKTGFWWIRQSDGKLCRIAPGGNRFRVVEPPLRYHEAERLHCLWLRRAGNRVYLRCDVETANSTATPPPVRPYLLCLPDTTTNAWGTPVLISENMRYADKTFLEKGWAYFICNENSSSIAAQLRDLFSPEHRQPLVSALYRIPLPE